MNRTKFFSSLLVGAMFLASTSVFVSCKDYDDDIKNLQTQIDKNTSAISAIQTLIQNGKVLQSVEPISGGIRITIDGTPYEIKNGTDGANGTVWTIGADGYWYKDGVATTYYALGTKGEKGDKGDQGEKGEKGEKGADGTNADGSSKYYVPNATTGTFWIYNDGDKQPYDSGISFIVEIPGQGATITAVRSNDTLTLFGVEGGEGALRAVAISLNGTLKSLVFMPHFYLDGIETIEYPWFGDSTLVKAPALATYTQDGTNNRSKMVHHGKTIAGNGEMYNYLPDNLSNLPQGPIPTRKAIIYGPVIGVDYEMNPSNSVLTWNDNLPTYKVLEPDVVYANTRAAAATLNITSPKTYGRYTEDADVFGIHAASSMNNSNVNYLTAGLKIERPDYLEPYPTSQDINGGYLPTTLDASYTLPWGTWYQWYKDDSGIHKDTDNTIALQMHNIENADVTSDYALLIPSRLRLEGLIWTKNPMYSEPGFGPTAAKTGDEKGWYSVNDQRFVFDSPEEALDNNDGAALEIAVDDPYIDLKTYLGIRILKENVKTRQVNAVDWNADAHQTSDGKFYGEEEYYDLHYEFSLVDYEVSGNVTRDSRYATFTDTKLDAAKDHETSYNGRIRALSVNEVQQTINQGSTTAVDREPLVRVLVKNKAGEVMLDGYILLHITNTNPNLNITSYPAQDKTFDLCNAVTYTTDWAQFSKLVLQDAMENMEKNTFDYFFWADCFDGGPAVSTTDAPFVTPNAKQVGVTADGHKTYSMKIFNFGTDIYGNGGVPPTKGNANGNLDPVNGTQLFENAPLGVVTYYPNADGQTNHRWEWTLSADEQEKLLEGKTAGQVVTVTRWIRFQAKKFAEANQYIPAGITPYTQDNYLAKYPYIWVKMTINLQRAAANKYAYAEKIDNYWFDCQTGASNGWAGWPIDIQAPGNASIPTIQGQPWNSRPSTTLVTNKVNINGATKYYFAPKAETVTDPNTGVTYTITPKSSASDTNFDKLICKYIVRNQNFTKVPTTDLATVQENTVSHTWTEAGLEAELAKCAVDYNKGVFTNNKLYAVKNGVYYHIATITQPQQVLATPSTHPGAGEIQLVKSAVTMEVLNAIGYPTDANGSCDFANSRSNINKQFRAWLGVIKDNGCGVAEYVYMDKTDAPNVCTFLASWERPINLAPMDPDYLLDANTGENYVFLIDYLKLYDWRGDKPNQGYMYDDHFWFWGYYNIKKITVDVRPQNVLTNMHQSNPSTFVKLSQVTTAANLWTWTNPAAYQTTLASTLGQFSFDLITPQYYKESNNAALKSFMGISPLNLNNKAQFGGFYYANNGDNVDEFDIIIPITVEYEWGTLSQNVKWHINTTHGR